MSQNGKVGWARGLLISFLSLSLLFATIFGYMHIQNNQKNAKKAPQDGPAIAIQAVNIEPGTQGWKLIFDDEFNGTAIDNNKWNVENYNAAGYQNCCLDYGLQYYTPDALTVKGGSLSIKTAKQTAGRYKYTSGAITTENKFSFLYGRVDVRAKLPGTQALWPAFWLLPDGSTRQAGGPFEIDLMELIGYNPHAVHMANHWGAGKKDAHSIFEGPDFSQGYHVFSVIWSRKAITWYIDGIERFSVSTEVSDKSMYIIMNTAIGGNFVGYPNSSTVLPQYMNIDYVHVYQLPS